MNSFLRIPLAGLAAFAACLAAVAATVVGGYYYVAPSMPTAEDLRDVRLQIPLRVYSRDGRLMAEFGEQRRTPVSFERLPQRLIDAVLAAEDHTFFEHPGLDFGGTARAAFNFLRVAGGERVPGGSTITQQVARDHPGQFLTRQYTLVRKFKELILALRLEREFTKQEILELFFNTTFFGYQSYGVAAAAQTYFNKELDQLTLSEVAILAGIPQGPSIMNPVASPENAAARRRYVLRRMLELGLIDRAEHDAALAEPIRSVRYGAKTELDAPYVAEMARAEMIRRFGPAAYTAGLRVTTTIDSRLQAASNRAIRLALTAYDERHGYRGPLARVDLDADESAGEERWRELLDDYPSLLGLEAALVLESSAEAARVYFRSRGEIEIGLDAVQWAAPFINDSAVGARPRAVTDVLARGDIVRFRNDAQGNLRLAQLPDVQGAFAAVDPQDGAVVALNGGIDFNLNNFNRAVQARRQPGSAFKPFVYSAALDNGYTTATIVNDAPLSLEDASLETVWRPENYNRQFHGETRLREALVESMNLVSVRVVRGIGIDNTIRHLRRFGFDDVALPRNLALSLGAGGVAPLDLAGGMAAFANGGFRVEPYFVERVEDSSGEVLYEARPAIACLECLRADEPPPQGGKAWTAELVDDIAKLYPPVRLAPQAISPQNAYLVADMLQDVVRRGTGAAAYRALRRGDMAGKTGTSNDRRDTWFAGFTADVVAVAWVGFDQDRPLGGNEQGGVTAIPMWIEFMAEALEGLPEHRIERPPGIVEVRINPETGLVASDSSRTSMFEKFEIDRVPAREADPVFSGPAGPSGPSDTPGRSQPQSIF